MCRTRQEGGLPLEEEGEVGCRSSSSSCDVDDRWLPLRLEDCFVHNLLLLMGELGFSVSISETSRAAFAFLCLELKSCMLIIDY